MAPDFSRRVSRVIRGSISIPQNDGPAASVNGAVPGIVATDPPAVLCVELSASHHSRCR